MWSLSITKLNYNYRTQITNLPTYFDCSHIKHKMLLWSSSYLPPKSCLELNYLAKLSAAHYPASFVWGPFVWCLFVQVPICLKTDFTAGPIKVKYLFLFVNGFYNRLFIKFC